MAPKPPIFSFRAKFFLPHIQAVKQREGGNLKIKRGPSCKKGKRIAPLHSANARSAGDWKQGREGREGAAGKKNKK
ncbi:hypothetical protein BCY91_12770 [Pelobium manganitolerans]|uniref:Uncharacterized protein n=1 Tax=Pelobium manganitolerans TaxID=1842495 RepID=A0A419S1Z4_9SPHI|nr:hypothetical protein BCY91_12770 [Pelobium manganitolerans]